MSAGLFLHLCWLRTLFNGAGKINISGIFVVVNILIIVGWSNYDDVYPIHHARQA